MCVCVCAHVYMHSNALALTGKHMPQCAYGDQKTTGRRQFSPPPYGSGRSDSGHHTWLLVSLYPGPSCQPTTCLDGGISGRLVMCTRCSGPVPRGEGYPSAYASYCLQFSVNIELGLSNQGRLDPHRNGQCSLVANHGSFPEQELRRKRQGSHTGAGSWPLPPATQPEPGTTKPHC